MKQFILGIILISNFLVGCASQQRRWREEDDRAIQGYRVNPRYGTGELPEGF